MTKLRITIPVLAIVLALALPGLALASSSGQTGYQGPNSAVAGVNEGNNNTPSGSAPVAEASAEEPTEESSGTLPFTGSDIAILVGAGAILLALGFTLRRLTHRPTRS
jgi:hypothetical protein